MYPRIEHFVIPWGFPRKSRHNSVANESRPKRSLNEQTRQSTTLQIWFGITKLDQLTASKCLWQQYWFRCGFLPNLPRSLITPWNPKHGHKIIPWLNDDRSENHRQHSSKPDPSSPHTWPRDLCKRAALVVEARCKIRLLFQMEETHHWH